MRSSSSAARRRVVLLAAALPSSGPAACAAFHWGAASATRHQQRCRPHHRSGGCTPRQPHPPQPGARRPLRLLDAPGGAESSSIAAPFELSADVDFSSLVVMDVVLFTRIKEDDSDAATTPNCKLELGAVQENGNVAPLSAWTLDSAYASGTADVLAFVVDEEHLIPGLSANEVRVRKVLDGASIGYGARQVGGGKGPGNPHGEESELLYYVERGAVEGTYRGRTGGEGGGAGGGGRETTMTIDVTVNPNLEHLW